MRLLIAVLYAGLLAGQSVTDSAAAIMSRVAANVEQTAEGRKQYIYEQPVRSSLIRGSGEPSRKEARRYSVFPGEKGTEKKLVSFKGEYRKGKAMIPYSERTVYVKADSRVPYQKLLAPHGLKVIVSQ